jgi:hypothetical protein
MTTVKNNSDACQGVLCTLYFAKTGCDEEIPNYIA